MSKIGTEENMTPDDAQDQRRSNGHDVSEYTAKQVIVMRKDLVSAIMKFPRLEGLAIT